MSNSLAYRGLCRNCGQERRIYYMGAPSSIKRAMELGVDAINQSDYQKHLNCIHCFTKHNVRGSVKYKEKLSKKQALRDLHSAKGGIQLDFDAFDRQFAEEKRLDAGLKNEEYRVKEYLKWKDKH